MKTTKNDIRRWYDALSTEQRRRVKDWLVNNPPPENWKSTAIGWAYLEMPISEFTLPQQDS